MEYLRSGHAETLSHLSFLEQCLLRVFDKVVVLCPQRILLIDHALPLVQHLLVVAFRVLLLAVHGLAAATAKQWNRLIVLIACVSLLLLLLSYVFIIWDQVLLLLVKLADMIVLSLPLHEFELHG